MRDLIAIALLVSCVGALVFTVTGCASRTAPLLYKTVQQ